MRQPLALVLCACLLAIPAADTRAQERTTGASVSVTKKVATMLVLLQHI